MTLEDLGQLLIVDYRLCGRRSLESTKQSLAHLECFFGAETPVEAITYNRIVAYVNARLEAGRSRATIRKELAALKRAFVLSRRENPLVTPPAFPQIRVQNARQGFIDGPKFERLKAVVAPHLRALIVFLFITGWRKTEATSLRWPQVDFEAGVVRIEPGHSKTGEGREFPFRDVPELDGLLRDQREHATRIEWNLSKQVPWVFHYPDGRPLRDFRDAWYRACEQAELPGLWIHDFRRSAIRNFERAQVRRQTAMKLSGHRTEEIYRRYAISDYSDLEDAAKAIGRLRQRDAAGAKQLLLFRRANVVDIGDASGVQADARVGTQREGLTFGRKRAR